MDSLPQIQGQGQARLKKGVDSNKSRFDRGSSMISIRKEKKLENVAKRRNIASTTNDIETLPFNPCAPRNTSSSSSTPQINNTTTEPPTLKLSELPTLKITLTNPTTTITTITSTLRTLRRLLSTDNPVMETISRGFLPIFVTYLAHGEKQIRLQAAWCLTNIAATEHTKDVAREARCIECLVGMLSDKEGEVNEQAAWCLGNIAGDGVELRDLVLQYSMLEGILANIERPHSTSLTRNCVWALSNLCRGKPAPSLARMHVAIPVLTRFVHLGVEKVKSGEWDDTGEEGEIVTDALWALSYISDGEDACIQAVIDGGGISPIVQLLASGSSKFITPALRTLGNLVSGSHIQTWSVCNSPVLQYLPPLLEHSDKNIRKEAHWLLSNITAGTIEQISLVFKAGSVGDGISPLIKQVVEICLDDDWIVRKEALWVIMNVALGGSDEQIKLLVRHGAIAAICSVLSEHSDTKLIHEALKSIVSILECGKRQGKNFTVLFDEADGIDLIERLQHHNSDIIYETAATVIEKFFSDDDGLYDDNEFFQPINNGDTFGFGIVRVDENTNLAVPSRTHNGTGQNESAVPRFNFQM